MSPRIACKPASPGSFWRRRRAGYRSVDLRHGSVRDFAFSGLAFGLDAAWCQVICGDRRFKSFRTVVHGVGAILLIR